MCVCSQTGEGVVFLFSNGGGGRVFFLSMGVGVFNVFKKF